MLVANRYEDIELLYPILRLAEEGAKVLVATVGSDEVKGMFGHPFPIPVMSDGNRYTSVDIKKLKADDIDCLYFPGGFSPDTVRLDQTTLDLVRDCNAKGKFLAAICHGPWVLISAGVMKGKKATCYVAIKDDVENSGAQFVDVPAIRDGNLITGRVPDDLTDLCAEITKALSE